MLSSTDRLNVWKHIVVSIDFQFDDNLQLESLFEACKWRNNHTRRRPRSKTHFSEIQTNTEIIFKIYLITKRIEIQQMHEYIFVRISRIDSNRYSTQSMCIMTWRFLFYPCFCRYYSFIISAQIIECKCLYSTLIMNQYDDSTLKIRTIAPNG